ncbi:MULTISPECIES: hypothetical protein [Bacteroidales]|nr:hypothetical protein [Porphyromonas crevioricanis]
MDKQKVNTTSSMKEKGYSSSSHYRIKSVVGQYAPDRTSLRAYLYGRIN